MPGTSHDLGPDGELSLAEEKRIAKLSKDELAAIDAAIVRATVGSYRKLAMVVGLVLEDVSDLSVPDIFISKRVRLFVESGEIEARGDLRRMRYCEIRRR